jgi:hypothetical protein
LGIGDWGLGIGDWGLGIGPNPQSPIPNPQINGLLNKQNNSFLCLIIKKIIKTLNHFEKIKWNQKIEIL